mgnify:CR=1 FL=1
MREDYNDICPFDFYVYDVLIKLIESEKEDNENENENEENFMKD